MVLEVVLVVLEVVLQLLPLQLLLLQLLLLQLLLLQLLLLQLRVLLKLPPWGGESFFLLRYMTNEQEEEEAHEIRISCTSGIRFRGSRSPNIVAAAQ